MLAGSESGVGFMSRLQSKKGIIFLLILAVVLITGGWSALVFNENHIRSLNGNHADVISGKGGYIVRLDHVSYKHVGEPGTKDRIQISGWAVKRGVQTTEKPVALKVVLKNEKTEEYYVIPTALHQREDVTKYFNDGCDYSNSGFSIDIPYSWKINPDQYEYAVYILSQIDGETALIDTKAAF